MLQRLFCVCALVLLGAAPTFDSSLDVVVKSHLTPSVSVAVVQNGKITYANARGAASVDTAYVIGSVTKMFTAVAVFQLIDSGKVSLDDPLAKYFKNYPHSAEITIRELLGHRSGIHNYGDDGIVAGEEYTAITPAGLIAKFEKKPLDFAPGTKWGYSNSGYVLLGQIVERVSHQPLAAYEAQHIFGPAGMAHTAMARAARGTVLATPYQVVGPIPLKLAAADLSYFYACGDVVSTATDLARFDIALMSGKLIKPSSFSAMQTVISKDSIEKGYDDGLGTFTHTVSGKTVIGHHGGEPGYGSDNEMIPADRFAVVVLMNTLADTDKVLAPVVATAYDTTAPSPPPADFAFVDAEHRLLGFVLALRQNSVDHATLTKAMSDAMTVDTTKQLADAFSTWGPAKELTFVQAVPKGNLVTYIFTLKCTDGMHTVTFTLDPDKKIAGIFFPAG